MSRIHITNTDRNWFDSEKYIDRWHSRGSHGGVMLWLTRSQNFVLNAYSCYEDSHESYNLISETEAFDWLIVNEFTADDMPKKMAKRFEDHCQKAEL